jgi:hypothetical protein
MKRDPALASEQREPLAFEQREPLAFEQREPLAFEQREPLAFEQRELLHRRQAGRSVAVSGRPPRSRSSGDSATIYV